ncbi:hypothetical protein WJX73_009885 [Symbiochloris irregularis]|uniref:F-box domain-containing protein n=1 Tax=Symbiochloris irregularis TaxID=706552 RepID=A0AAW1NRN9_9CHLO
MSAASRTRLGLFETAIQDPLAKHMLPALVGRGLGCLACTCRAGRELVDQADTAIWRNIADHRLPPRHPLRNSCEASEIRAALNAFTLSRANLRTGQIQCELHIPKVIGSPKFAPNGRDFAVIVEDFMGEARAQAEGDDDDNEFCLIVFLEDGTQDACELDI